MLKIVLKGQTYDQGQVKVKNRCFQLFYFFPAFRGSSGASFHADQRGANYFPEKDRFRPPEKPFLQQLFVIFIEILNLEPAMQSI